MFKLSFFLISLILPNFLFAQSGKVFDNLSMQSTILKSIRKYAVYLPPDYDTSERSYPVLYLLHGAGDDHSGWIQFGEVHYIADKAIREGDCTPMIIVMPDANSGQRGYYNSVRGDWRYEDFFIQEFIPYIEKTYRTRPEKRYRAVAGLSMGGGGTFLYALHYPDLFSSACPLSAGVGPIKFEETREYLVKWGNIENATEEEADIFYKTYSVLYLINNMPEENKNAVRWYIDCGDDDFLFEGNSLVHIAMRKNKIPHEFRIRDGNHSWEYWRQSLPEVLKFVSKSFHK